MSGILNSVMSSLKTSVADYSDLEAPFTYSGKNIELPCFSLRNGGFVTFYEIKGAATFIGENRFFEQIDTINKKLSKTLANQGYRLEFVFVRDPYQTQREIKKSLDPIRQTIKTLQLDLDGLIDEREKTLSKSLVSEKCFLVIKTNPSILPSSLQSSINKKRQKRSKDAGIKPGVFAQSPFVGFKEILVNHAATCTNILSALDNFVILKTLNHNEALRELKIQIEPYSTGDKWETSLLGDKLSPKLVKEVGLSADISHITNSDLSTQLFSRSPELIKEDSSTIKHDGIYYAPLMVSGAQSRPTPFRDLFNSMPKEIPWRINISIDTNHNGLVTKLNRKKGYASFLAFSNGGNKLIRDSCNELISTSQTNTLVSANISVCTWADTYEKLIERKENVNQFLQNWGGLEVKEELGDPIESWMNNLPGISSKKISPDIILPFDELLYMLPINRPTSPWESGTTLFNTIDYKLYATESASSIQAFTSELTFAPPGSGKSFKLSALNMALILKPGNTKLPKIKIIDIGFSSSSFVAMLRDSLPESKKYLAQTIMLENTTKKAINMFSTPTGNRFPLAIDRQAQAGLLEMLLTPAGSEPIKRLPEICSSVIDELYKKFHDDKEPNIYRHGLEVKLDEKLEDLGFNTSYERTWWEVVDFFMRKRMVSDASTAQKHAMPLLSDVTAILKSEAIKSVYENAIYEGEYLLDFASQMVISALQDYPILTQPSAIDVSSARILSVDLQNVAKKGNSQANKQTAIMYLLARSICCYDFYFHKEDLDQINPEYQDYYSDLIESESGIPKKLCMDEFHRTEGFPQIRNQVEMDIREGRKYDIIVSLLSQSLDDFTPKMSELATNIYILAKGISEETPRKIKQKFSPTSDSMNEFRLHVKAPNKEGSSMLYLADVNNTKSRVECVLRLRLGPEEIWAYSTTPKDVALRRILVKQIGLNKTLKILAKEFPGGSAEKYIEKYKRSLKDLDINPITQIKEDLILKYSNAA